MKKLLVLLLLLPSVSLANNQIQYLETFIPSMIEYIENNSNLEYNGKQYPTLLIQDAEQICKDVYDPPRGPDCTVAGYYNNNDNIIVIVDKPTEFMTEDRFQEVILLHELVHFLQYANGTDKTVECRQNLEIDAFRLQQEFVEDQQIDPKQKPDPLYSLLVAMCPNAHPLLFGEQ